MGKRTMEKGQEGLGQGDLMIRVPREDEDEGEEDEGATNPWQFLLLDPRRVSRFQSVTYKVLNNSLSQAKSSITCWCARFDKSSQIHLMSNPHIVQSNRILNIGFGSNATSKLPSTMHCNV